MPATHASELQKEYKRIAGGYAKRNARIEDFTETLKSAQQFASLLPKGAKILDLGCGNGRDADWFAHKGFAMTLFDLSDEMLVIAQRRVPNAKIMQGDMTSLPFEKESFEGIWANASLLHLTKKEVLLVLEKIRDILTADGKVFISLKSGKGEKYLKHDKYGTESVRFFSLFSLSEIAHLVEKAKLTIIQKEEVESGSGQGYIHLFARK